MPGIHPNTSDIDDLPINISLHPDINELLSRRQLSKGIIAEVAEPLFQADQPLPQSAQSSASTLLFDEIPNRLDEALHLPPGYQAHVMMRWGDPVHSHAADFKLHEQSAENQRQQFGYNNDFIAFLPLDRHNAGSSRGLLSINHEYTNPHLMFPGIKRKKAAEKLDEEQVAVEMAAHGHTVMEVRRLARGWVPVLDSPYNRRINALDTEMAVSGPAAGHERLRTKADPAGRHVIGTLNNGSGGVTPWGTVLICEENFDQYFYGDPENSAEEAENHRRYGIREKERMAWHRYHKRFDLLQEPHEPNRFGWVVEIDPYDPDARPVKRTALGRFKHKGATCVLNSDGRVVVYSGDEQRFEYVYRFVSAGRYNPSYRAANRQLLDDGVLSVARFHEDGRLEWLPLIWGEGPLTEENAFYSQADVLIEARRAADLLGATPMDRPEDIQANPVNGRVYVLMTKNKKRTEEQVNPANPRAHNRYGHVLEITPAGGDGPDADHAADIAHWEMFLLGGDPAEDSETLYHPDVSEHGWLACPDTCAFDNRGRLWIGTDGAPKAAGFADGIWACDTDGQGRGLTRHFLSAPMGAEAAGPCFTPDNRTLFLSIQHPGEKSADSNKPDTRWPDFDDKLPPRPAVIAITREDGGEIG